MGFPRTFILNFLLALAPQIAVTIVENKTSENGGEMLILVPKGQDPLTSKNRIIIQRTDDGQKPPLPCVVNGAGIYEHGQTFTKENFHYRCQNGTAEVIACLAEDMSVIQIGRTFIRNGIRHKCLITPDSNTVAYEQKGACFANGVNYDVGSKFKNGSFLLICKDDGVAIAGCFTQEGNYTLEVGESKIIGNQKHNCEVLGSGKIRYSINLLGCQYGNETFNPGQIFTVKYMRYECTSEGFMKVLGCVDDDGTFVEVGRDVRLGKVIRRCYNLNNTTNYHRFYCDESKPLSECIKNDKI